MPFHVTSDIKDLRPPLIHLQQGAHDHVDHLWIREQQTTRRIAGNSVPGRPAGGIASSYFLSSSQTFLDHNHKDESDNDSPPPLLCPRNHTDCEWRFIVPTTRTPTDDNSARNDRFFFQWSTRRVTQRSHTVDRHDILYTVMNHRLKSLVVVVLYSQSPLGPP